MQTILLKFAGPLQSWGTNSNYETRYTDRYPSKSAVIGMIAACLGYRRNDDEKIRKLNKLDFGVRIDQPGKILRDFQIASKYKSNGDLERTYVTNRYYLQDAVFLVGIGSEDTELLDNIKNALKTPCFQPFLGRRSLPLNADFYIKTTNENVIESLKTKDWYAADWYKNKNTENIKLDIYIDGNLECADQKFMTKDLVYSFSQNKRQYSFRPVSKFQILVETEHDVFKVIGG